MANKGIQEGNDGKLVSNFCMDALRSCRSMLFSGHPTEVVSEIQETGQLEVESVHKNISQAADVVREGNGVDKGMSEAEKVGAEGSQKAEAIVQAGETETEEKTAESQAEVGEKRQRPAETGEVKEAQAEEGDGKKAKRAKKAAEKKAGEEKPLKERRAKTTAKAKIQAAETTTTTKKRTVGRPRKLPVTTTTTEKDDGMEVVEAAPVQGETAEEAKTADPIT